MLPSTKFDCIFAIDSIFFVRNQTNVIQILRDPLNPQGKMGLFAHCLPNVSALETPLAQALDQLKLEYTPCDLSAENNAHWVKKKQTLLELEPMFRAEGNEFLFRNRLAECDGLANVHRYLYLVTAS